ncbi:MAG: sugar phosphate isomerase/epimerase [Rhizobiales bacterium]|nr:sugar phosphate isomerase/epimerase [Hyphomicrobiales bacterium]MBI3674698.1 sugar phosphate isomerase/epimerase [Hyphomicrobiales bacterium]
MKLGAYTACLHDQPLPEALRILKNMGLEGAEINSGGFLPPVHVPVNDILSSRTARDDYLGQFAEVGMELTALNCNGNPLHPDPAVGHGRDLKQSIELAARLGVKRIVTMSGTPGTGPEARLPAWTIMPWDSAYMDARDYQWNDVAIPFWKDIQARAAAHDVRIAIEMHPHNIVYNAATMIRLAEAIDATHVGAEMDPSHLMWQGCDPVAVVRHLGALIYNAAAKDVRINPAAKINGVLDDRFRRVEKGAPGYLGLGGSYSLCAWPETSSWDFVAVGIGNGVGFWTEFLAALREIDPGMPVNIEHEDASMTQIEGLRFAANTLRQAHARMMEGSGLHRLARAG